MCMIIVLVFQANTFRVIRHLDVPGQRLSSPSYTVAYPEQRCQFQNHPARIPNRRPGEFDGYVSTRESRHGMPHYDYDADRYLDSHERRYSCHRRTGTVNRRTSGQNRKRPSPLRHARCSSQEFSRPIHSLPRSRQIRRLSRRNYSPICHDTGVLTTKDL